MRRILTETDEMVRRAALGMTRRRFFRNGSAAALSFAIGTAYLGRRGVALAYGSANHPCGPSPYCPRHRCYNGDCSNAAGRKYGHYACNPRQGGQCWTEDYRSQGRGLWQCCDCCAFDGGGKKCSSCGDASHRYACICHLQIG